ncbi:MAG TPA: sn-glycerol-3-phosphate ABC transporter ATP-binding protein UgpC [Candidatus Limnocylindrales bacterium]|jgi:multiple sugar transport system ATP-binding protein|nr:sn-glycerol-3-phosphate ABC transporter ATP-binding protein UgpC [Candidatus Limnocylindrales bacterium]
MATVTFDHMYKRYGEDVVAVNDLNLEINDGEFICLVGPSGCGKTTALRCVAGLEEITDGELRIGDRVVNNVAPKDRDIAMVFQSYALYPHMSVYDNLAFGLKLRKMKKDEIDRRVQEGAKILGLEKFLDRKPKALSGGQRQRVALGRAIVREPSVFLMDEPLSNLDAKLRVQTRAEIARLHQRLGTTTIYVTHDQVEAMTMGDRIAVMKDGVLQQVGTPQELYDHPTNIFVAGFIGSPAMNFATTKAEGKDLLFGGAKLELTGDQARAADSRPQGSSVLIGFRPEHIELANGTNGANAVRFPATVEVVEYLGNEELIHAQAEGSEIVALLPSDKKVAVGDNVQFAVPMEKLHIFDPDSEQALAG